MRASGAPVTQLAAERLTSREIAQALFITTKTRQGPPQPCYRKLEITHRGQLATALTGFSTMTSRT